MDVLAAKPPMIFRTFTEELERAAARRPGPAIWDGHQWHSWRDCWQQAERTAAALHRHGLVTGDVLATQLPNSWELVVLHAATARLGVLLLPLHQAYRSYELEALIRQAGAVALVAAGSYRGHDRAAEIAGLRGQCPSLRHVWLSPGPAAGLPGSAELLAGAPVTADPLPPAPADPDTPMVLLASSGTTSRRPKLCVHRHAGLLGNAAAVAADAGFDDTDVIVSASPLSHAFGLLSVHLALVLGGGVGLFDGWDPRRFLGQLAAAGATVAFGVPAQLRDVLGEVEADPGLVPTGLREVRTGGAPVSQDLAVRAGRLLGARVIVQWGMTEIGAGTHTRPADPPEAVSTVGRPVTGSEVRVVDGNGAPVGPDVVGELQFRSPMMFSGYFRAPEVNEAALTADGWLRTGDLAALAADGSVLHRGRTDEMINRGGLKYSAIEVEELLHGLPQLAQHAIVALPDERLGQRSCLVAALREGADLTLEEVVAYLSGRGLANYKLPERLIIVDRLPTTVTGKLARAGLRAIAVPAEAGR